MIRTSKYFVINIICFSLVICLNSYVAAEPPLKKAELQITDGKISAQLINASLRDIARKIKAQGVIWFEADADLSDYNISVRFTDIPLDEGLRRILRGMNHSLFYNTDNSVTKMFILGKGEKNQRNSTPAIVPFNTHASKPPTTTSTPAGNSILPKISNLKSVNPSHLPRALSGMRSNTLDMSLNLKNRF